MWSWSHTVKVGFVIFCLLPFCVHADEDTAEFLGLQPGSYIGGSVFHNRYFLETSDNPSGLNFSQRRKGKTSFGIQVGNFYGQSVGLEMDYQRFTSPWINRVQRLKTNAFGVSLIGRSFLMPGVYVWLGMGLVRLTTSTDCVAHSTDCLYPTTQITRHTSPRISAGVATVLAPHLALSVGYHVIYKAAQFSQVQLTNIRGVNVAFNYLF